MAPAHLHCHPSLACRSPPQAAGCLKAGARRGHWAINSSSGNKGVNRRTQSEKQYDQQQQQQSPFQFQPQQQDAEKRRVLEDELRDPSNFVGYLAPRPLRLVFFGVFAEGGMKSYLQYVRNSSEYSSRYLASSLEWRDDVPDGLEVSIYNPTPATADQPCAVPYSM